jgi:uncharacterized membrane protein HdeD (DUF308 family)
MNTKNPVLFMGVVFLAIGILGFFNNPILGLFEVDTLYNLIHLASGIIVLGMAMSGEDGARTFSKMFGVVYAVLGVFGLLYPGDTLFGTMPDTVADNVLHLVLGAIMLGLGYATQAKRMSSSSSFRYNQ